MPRCCSRTPWGSVGTGLTPSSRTRCCWLLCIEIYNDAMAEIQEGSNLRFLPMPPMPVLDADLCVQETQRCVGLGLRGINMTSDPQDLGSPDLASRLLDPFWEVCAESPHAGAFPHRLQQHRVGLLLYDFWASQDEHVKPAIGGALLFLNSARVVINTVFAGTLTGSPTCRWSWSRAGSAGSPSSSRR